MDLKRSFAPVADTRTRLLVLGSLPGERSLAAGRYYAHPQNQFWALMSGVIERDLTALSYEGRLSTLLDRSVGVWDVVASATRVGSSDAAIRDMRTNDLVGLITTLPFLRAIAFNGATALKTGTRQLVGTPHRLSVIALPSSSPLHTIGLEAKRPAWDALRACLYGLNG